MRTCTHCGHQGEDVRLHAEYVGGQGYVESMCCDDVVECWERRDAKHMRPDYPSAAKAILAQKEREAP